MSIRLLGGWNRILRRDYIKRHLSWEKPDNDAYLLTRFRQINGPLNGKWPGGRPEVPKPTHRENDHMNMTNRLFRRKWRGQVRVFFSSCWFSRNTTMQLRDQRCLTIRQALTGVTGQPPTSDTSLVWDTTVKGRNLALWGARFSNNSHCASPSCDF